MKKIVFTFGRYNPPTTGHAELIRYTANLARKTGADHRIYTSQSHDPSKNPLAPRQKMAFLRQIFPGVNFVDDPNMKTAFAICKDRKSTRLNSSHSQQSRMPSSA